MRCVRACVYVWVYMYVVILHSIDKGAAAVISRSFSLSLSLSSLFYLLLFTQLFHFFSNRKKGSPEEGLKGGGGSNGRTDTGPLRKCRS